MRRFLSMLFILLTIACQALTPDITTVPPEHAPLAAPRAAPRLAAPTATSALNPAPEDEASTAFELRPFEVRVHPDGDRLYAGDMLSFEVIAPPGAAEFLPFSLEEAEVSIRVEGSQPVTIGPVRFGRYGIAGRMQATLIWAWDTGGLEPGDYQLTFVIAPAGLTWTETVSLLPQSELPFVEAQSHWESAQSNCCTLNYMTSTAAGRDLPELLAQAEIQTQDALEQMGLSSSEPFTITLLARMLGHGGFANEEAHVTYLDRNYMSYDFSQVLHHELIHLIDRRMGGELRPSLLVEGLAVYLSGGHFKREPLLPRAAVLLDSWEYAARGGLGWYIPLEVLANDFYNAQHEVGYLEAGALIEYMVGTWGWQAFTQFYRDIHPNESGNQAQAISTALRQHFGLTLAELEAGFLEALARQPADLRWLEDVELTIRFYETARRYQLALDPAAYFKTAWLLDSREMRKRGILADYLRHPEANENIATETMLAEAGRLLRQGNYASTRRFLEAVMSVLQAIDQQSDDPFSQDSLAVDFFAITGAVQGQPANSGYKVQRIAVWGDKARVWITTDQPELIELALERFAGRWIIQGEAIGFSEN